MKKRAMIKININKKSSDDQCNSDGCSRKRKPGDGFCGPCREELNKNSYGNERISDHPEKTFYKTVSR